MHYDTARWALIAFTSLTVGFPCPCELPGTVTVSDTIGLLTGCGTWECACVGKEEEDAEKVEEEEWDWVNGSVFWPVKSGILFHATLEWRLPDGDRSWILRDCTVRQTDNPRSSLALSWLGIVPVGIKYRSYFERRNEQEKNVRNHNVHTSLIQAIINVVWKISHRPVSWKTATLVQY